MQSITASLRQFFIQDVTHGEKTFCPSGRADWLCGVMTQFCPTENTGGPRLICFPHVRPVMLGSIRSAFVNERLHDIEPKTLDFVLNFAYNNNLQFVEVCILSEGSAFAKV